MKRLTVLAILALPLAGCLSLGGKPPKVVLTLTPAAQLPVGATQSSVTAKTITIQVPIVPQELAVARVPVHTTGGQIGYVVDAAWIEAPQRLFARLMSDTIAAKTGRVVLTPAQSFADPGARLSGELRNFGIDGTTREAVVTFDATLIRSDASKIDKKRFEARVPLAAIDAGSVGPALNQAANQVAAEVADWVGSGQ